MGRIEWRGCGINNLTLGEDWPGRVTGGTLTVARKETLEGVALDGASQSSSAAAWDLRKSRITVAALTR